MDVVKRFTGEIASRLSKASTLPTTAQTLSSQGLREHAFDTLMNVETLIFETTAWLNASSTINRRDGGKNEPPSKDALHRSKSSRPVLLCAAGARGRGSLANSRMASTEGSDQ
jgi:hypothetical protein